VRGRQPVSTNDEARRKPGFVIGEQFWQALETRKPLLLLERVLH
jgi:hypothetical protein